MNSVDYHEPVQKTFVFGEVSLDAVFIVALLAQLSLSNKQHNLTQQVTTSNETNNNI